MFIIMVMCESLLEWVFEFEFMYESKLVIHGLGGDFRG